MEWRPHWYRAAALAAGLLIFALAGGGCAARHAPSAPPADVAAAPTAVAPAANVVTPPPTAPDVPPTRTIETADAKLAAAIATLKSSPTPDSLKSVAAEYLRLGIFDQAIDSLTRALAMAPADAALFAMRARAWRDWGQPDTGLGDAHRAAYLAPRSADAFNTLGTIQFALNQTAEARMSFERALELMPDAVFPLSNLCYLALIQGDEATALARCSAALERDPASTPARNNLALVHAAAGRLDEARKLFLESADKAGGHYNMGIVLMSRREYAAAALSFSDACRLRPSFDAACRTGRGSPWPGLTELIATPFMTTAASIPLRSADIPMPTTLEASGLRLDMVVQLLVKTLHLTGEMTGTEWAERLGLAFTVIEAGVETMKSERLCEIVGGTALGPLTYRYRITTLGRERAAIFLDRNLYVGFAPVPLEQYRRYMREFDETAPKRIARPDVERGFSHLVLSQKVLDQLGPAVNSGQSLFVYGPPGNGKTVISQAIRNLLPGDIWIPHALEVDGSIIQVFDPINHDAFPPPKPTETFQSMNQYDRRWERCRRPLVTVGGEMVLEALDLTYNPTSGIYRPSLQLMANGGVLVIDDFGRQRCSPVAMLNRWVHPLESRVDYLVLQSGQKVEVPFLTLPVFATNIRPEELVDEAFLRRIQYKILAQNPTEEEFARIFEKACLERGIGYEPDHVRHLLDNVYARRGIPFRGCHPRDLIGQALALGQYLGESKALTVPLLDAAVATYFIDDAADAQALS